MSISIYNQGDGLGFVAFQANQVCVTSNIWYQREVRHQRATRPTPHLLHPMSTSAERAARLKAKGTGDGELGDSSGRAARLKAAEEAAALAV